MMGFLTKLQIRLAAHLYPEYRVQLYHERRRYRVWKASPPLERAEFGPSSNAYYQIIERAEAQWKSMSWYRRALARDDILPDFLM